MDDNLSLRQRRKVQAVPIPATNARKDLQAESILAPWLKGRIPTVDFEFAKKGAINRALSTENSSRLARDHQPLQ